MEQACQNENFKSSIQQNNTDAEVLLIVDEPLFCQDKEEFNKIDKIVPKLLLNIIKTFCHIFWNLLYQISFFFLVVNLFGCDLFEFLKIHFAFKRLKNQTAEQKLS